jgi:hypothetical protein
MGPEQPAEAQSEQVAIEATKVALLRFVCEERPKGLFYLGQLEVLFEDRPIIEGKRGKKGPFHWITSKAVMQLAAEGRISSEAPSRSLGAAPHGMRFFHARSHRDWRRQARKIEQIVGEFSRPEFTRGIGQLLELLVDSGMASVCGGFRIAAKNANEWNGRRWTKTDENLDRIYVSKDGVAYGCEIKNTLPYIEHGEFDRKLEMCVFLGLRPLFVGRMMPESYIDAVWRIGGFSLVLKNQIYPLGFESLAARVRGALGLPVVCAQSIPAGDLERFVKWHEGRK